MEVKYVNNTNAAKPLRTGKAVPAAVVETTIVENFDEAGIKTGEKRITQVVGLPRAPRGRDRTIESAIGQALAGRIARLFGREAEEDGADR